MLQTSRCVGRRKLEQMPRVRPGYPGAKRHRLEEVPALPMRSCPLFEGREAGSRSPGCPEAACLPLGPEGPQRPEGLSGAIAPEPPLSLLPPGRQQRDLELL